jgi:glycosyltransferase involved in cell wall biosynthesis
VSGGDKFFLEFTRHWRAGGHRVTHYVTEEGRDMIAHYGLASDDVVVIPCRRWLRFGIEFHYLVKSLLATSLAWRVRPASDRPSVFFSASDSLPDVWPALLARLVHHDVPWVAAFYFFAPTPWRDARDIAYRGGRIPPSPRSVGYWLIQQFCYPLIRWFARFVLVCNELDVERFEADGYPRAQVWPLYGGVDLTGPDAVPDPGRLDYEGVFVGRFHIQKGVLELIDIWAEVVRHRPAARLAIIGQGDLQPEMERRIAAAGLGERIDILGYRDGAAKFDVFKRSRVFLHPPILDTGGMAAAEGMACGLPVVGFDLPGYRHCYPRGMIRVPRGDARAFAAAVLRLLDDPAEHARLSAEAVAFTRAWSWDRKSDEALHCLATLARPAAQSS